MGSLPPCSRSSTGTGLVMMSGVVVVVGGVGVGRVGRTVIMIVVVVVLHS